MFFFVRFSDYVSTFEHSFICVLCLPGLPRMVVIRDYNGIPSPHCGPPLSIHAGDVIELMLADLHSSWWQVRVTQLILFYLDICDSVKKITCYGSQGWLGARNVFAVSSVWIRISSVFPADCPALWQTQEALKNIRRSDINNLFPFGHDKWYYVSFHSRCEVSHKYAIMMSAASIRNIS